MGECPRDAAGINGAGFRMVREGSFKREGVAVKPVEEGGGAEDSRIGVLGSVDVGVCRRVRIRIPVCRKEIIPINPGKKNCPSPALTIFVPASPSHDLTIPSVTVFSTAKIVPISSSTETAAFSRTSNSVNEAE